MSRIVARRCSSGSVEPSAPRYKIAAPVGFALARLRPASALTVPTRRNGGGREIETSPRSLSLECIIASANLVTRLEEETRIGKGGTLAAQLRSEERR